MRKKFAGIGFIDYNSPVIINYMLICIAAYIINVVTDNYINLIVALPGQFISNPLLYHKIFLYVFGHGSFEHLINNIALLALVGPSVEHKYGSTKLICWMMINTVTIGLLHGFFFSGMLVGASGIAFMLIIMSAFTQNKGSGLPMTMLVVLFCYLGNEVLGALNVNDNVSQFSHITSGLMGLVFGLIELYKNKRKNKRNKG